SDHSLGYSVAVAAVAVGAVMIEKHITLKRSDGGPDSSFSLEPMEFSAMVAAVRQAEQALGRVTYEIAPDEATNLRFRRSLFVVRNLKRGDAFDLENVRSIRPADGLHTRYLQAVLGRRATRDIARGTPLTWDLIR